MRKPKDTTKTDLRNASVRKRIQDFLDYGWPVHVAIGRVADENFITDRTIRRILYEPGYFGNKAENIFIKKRPKVQRKGRKRRNVI